MEALLQIFNLLKLHSDDAISAAAHLVLFGSIIVKMTPTLKDDNYFKPFIKFVGKYIALDKYGPGGDKPSE